jgi:hypothetical protein
MMVCNQQSLNYVSKLIATTLLDWLHCDLSEYFTNYICRSLRLKIAAFVASAACMENALASFTMPNIMTD